MDWQLMAVTILVAAALAYLARTTWRTWKKGQGACGGACSCAAAPKTAEALIPAASLTLRRHNPKGSSTDV
jgi:hypothetical protein